MPDTHTRLPRDGAISLLDLYGFGVPEVAAHLGVTERTLRLWLRGRRPPPPWFTVRLAGLLGEDLAIDVGRFIAPHPARVQVGSPGVIALRRADATLSDVATPMGVSRAAVSMWLAGRRPAPRELRDALTDLLGDRAAPVIEAVPWWRR